MTTPREERLAALVSTWERRVVGGRAWTEEQSIWCPVLLDCARELREALESHLPPEPANTPRAGWGCGKKHLGCHCAACRKALEEGDAAPPEETDRAEGMARALEGLLKHAADTHTLVGLASEREPGNGPWSRQYDEMTGDIKTAHKALAAYRSSHPVKGG